VELLKIGRSYPVDISYVSDYERKSKDYGLNNMKEKNF
jgi:hypothetical protein